ncbi:right-handed parallel beta-helix repeat-containing protein [Larkinella insperata]|uniref:Right-handed parallel beta-helix repeat-containing protein n=1 Tax=Larkinella insperata TaxID=332158 RepID=A0ABW3Q7U7_9BACT|nr:right-handed parallel beta-helix repeat-containing protein [Larkinella insperata]
MKTTFIRLFFFGLFLSCFSSLKAANYYFSSQTGDDSRTSLQAQNQATPWKTLSKLNSFFSHLQPGDAVLFKRGETFYGQIIISKSGSDSLPITIADYGSGHKPIISGFIKLSNWISRGNGIWETAHNDLTNSVNILTINGQVEPMGRYPNADAANKGYLTYESHLGNTRITDNQLNSNQNWTGAEVVIRKNRWILDRGIILQHSGTSLTYSGSSHYQAEDNFGYFIQNHLATLDKSGEWHLNKSTKKITLYLNNGLHPNSLNIKVALINTLIQNSGKNFIKFQNLYLEGADHTVFNLLETHNLSISNCTIKSSTNGILGQNNSSLVIEDSEISDSGNNGIYLTNSTNVVIRTNTINRTGLISGMGMNGDDTYQALIIRGSGNLVEKNKVTNTGYSAIRFEGDYTVLRNNFISNFNLVKDDGGGIYSWNGDSIYPEKGSQVLNNIIINGIGARNGTSDSKASATNGIYMDDNTGSVEVKGNTIAFCNGSGIFLHNANHIDVSNNTVFDNESQLFMLQNSEHKVRNNSIHHNRFFSKHGHQLISKIYSNLNDIKDFSSFDNNYYCRPLDDRYVINTYSNYHLSSGLSIVHTLAKWQSSFILDINSHKTPIQIPSYQIKTLLGDNKFLNGSFTNHINYAYSWSPSGNINLDWSNTGGLNGGCLKTSFNTTINPSVRDRSALITMEVGAVSAAKKYILKFSLRGTNDQRSFQVFLRKRDFPYNDLSPRYQCDMSSIRNEKEFAFPSLTTEANAYLVFQVDQTDGTFFIDNLQLREADLALTNPDDYIRFEYNASDSKKTINLNNTIYVDVENRSYQGYLTLAPWSSIILLKKTASTSAKSVSDLPSSTPTLLNAHERDSSSIVFLQTYPSQARLIALADDAIDKSTLKVTPNPTKEEFEVSFYTPKQTISELTVIDELGRPWHQKILEGTGFQRQKIHIPGAVGRYVVVLRQGSQVYNKKIIIR